jgi:transposase
VEGNSVGLQVLQSPQRVSAEAGSGSVSCEICPLKKQILELGCERGYWEKQHQRAREREEKLEEEIQQLKARIRYLEKELYGRKSEKPSGGSERKSAEEQEEEKKPRGHQEGAPGHGRRNNEHLPVVEEVYELAEGELRCPICGLPYEPLRETEDSEQVEVEVRAYRRRIRRRRYRRSCRCEGNARTVTARGPLKLIPKGTLGISVWAMILVEKYLYQRPIARILESMKGYGLDIAAGTVGDGLKRLAGLFAPLQGAIEEKSRQEGRWHADETRWQVFELPEGKLSHRWYLWVFVSPQAVVYILDPGRSAEVIEGHLGEIEEGILCVDRYAAYKKFAKDRKGVILAFCWTHQRRDFLKVANGRPELAGWGQEWLHAIGYVFHLNHQRLAHEIGSEGFLEADERLRQALEEMENKREEELARKGLEADCLAVLKSMREHWEGLRVFVEHPQIPMDNSEAERKMRGPAVGRKNYYGSGRIWSGQFTASLFSVFQTLLKWEINPRQWLVEYLEACAENGGRPAEDIAPFLPWNMSEEDRKRMRTVHIRGHPA